MQRILLVSFSFVAGYVDACTFLALFGLFVAQVTGSFVIAGAELIEHETGFVIKAMAIPVFILAAAATAVMVAMVRRAGQSAWSWTLGLETILLTAFVGIGWSQSPFSDPDQPAALAAGLCGLAAMGVQSAAVRLLGNGAPSTNVMTTNTTQFAIDAAQLAMAKLGVSAAATAQVRARFAETFRVMVGFFVGVIVGAPAFRLLGFVGLIPTIAILLALLVAAERRGLE